MSRVGCWREVATLSMGAATVTWEFAEKRKSERYERSTNEPATGVLLVSRRP